MKGTENFRVFFWTWNLYFLSVFLCHLNQHFYREILSLVLLCACWLVWCTCFRVVLPYILPLLLFFLFLTFSYIYEYRCIWILLKCYLSLPDLWTMLNEIRPREGQTNVLTSLSKLTFHYKAFRLFLFHLEPSAKYFEMELYTQILSHVPNLKLYQFLILITITGKFSDCISPRLVTRTQDSINFCAGGMYTRYVSPKLSK